MRRGYRFDAARGEHFIKTVSENFRLYEGTRFAGKLFEFMDYQRDFAMRLYSWVVWSDFLKQWIRRFRRASLWVPKKNGKSPFAAANGLYMTTSDGEFGGKTFSTAKDGKQAQIVHEHAIKMVEQSPQLMRECEINRTNKRILHSITNSFYGVIAGDNIEGQEGLNGNAIIDEGHVVDSRLAGVLEYMGAGRDEPIELMVSTAGSNMLGWGRRRYEYGERVNRGDVDDLEFLHQAFAAPERATDDDLMKPEVWAASNPALGKIINPEVFARELLAAKSKGGTDWSRFKMYRFNVWQKASTPWIDGEVWDACRADYSLEDFRDSSVFFALDGSLSGDMTCLQIIRPIPRDGWAGPGDDEEGKVYQLWPLLYITRDAVEKHGDKAPFEVWANAGHLRIIESSQIDYLQVEQDAIDTARDLNLSVQGVTHEAVYATGCAQKIASRLGCELIVFRTSLLEYAEPTDAFERLLKLHLIQHPGNMVLTWQAGHVEATLPNRQGWRMPVKPQATDKIESRQAHASIDGISAAVMGLRDARKFGPHASVYEQPGALSL